MKKSDSDAIHRWETLAEASRGETPPPICVRQRVRRALEAESRAATQAMRSAGASVIECVAELFSRPRARVALAVGVAAGFAFALVSLLTFSSPDNSSALDLIGGVDEAYVGEDWAQYL